MTFGEKLQRLRKLNHLSQEKLAEKLNVSRQAISKWEMGAMPDMDNVIKISNFFDCSLDYLLNNEITEINGDYKKEKNTEDGKTIKSETVCAVVSITALFAMVILWIVSKFMDVGIFRQDASTGNWYTGFSGFIEYYGLRGLVYGLALILMFSLTVRMYFQLFVRHKVSNKKYVILRVVTWLFCILGIAAWLYITFHPWTFLWNTNTYIAVGAYCFLAITSAIAALYFERG